jgi:hypothetical protein
MTRPLVAQLLVSKLAQFVVDLAKKRLERLGVVGRPLCQKLAHGPWVGQGQAPWVIGLMVGMIGEPVSGVKVLEQTAANCAWARIRRRKKVVDRLSRFCLEARSDKVEARFCFAAFPARMKLRLEIGSFLPVCAGCVERVALIAPK